MSEEKNMNGEAALNEEELDTVTGGTGRMHSSKSGPFLNNRIFAVCSDCCKRIEVSDASIRSCPQCGKPMTIDMSEYTFF